MARSPGRSHGLEALAPAAVPAAASRSGSARLLLELILAVGLTLSLLAVAVAATPPWALPRSVAGFVYDRRASLIFGGLAPSIGIGLGLAIALLLS